MEITEDPQSPAPPTRALRRAPSALALNRPPFFTPGFVTQALALLLLPSLVRPGTDLDLSWLWLLGAAAAITGIRFLLRPGPEQRITFAEQHFQIPQRSGGARLDQVRYADLLSLDLRRRGPQGFLVISAPQRVYMLPRELFARPLDQDLMFEELLFRVSSQPDGEAHLRRMKEGEVLGRQMYVRRTWVAEAILGLLVLAFLAQRLLGDEPLLGVGADLSWALRLGANAPALVRHGEWWRLVSANFMHANWIHLLLNGLSLLAIGPQVERAFGKLRFLSIYLVSAVGGALASALAGDSLSLGASTAVFGVFGALAVATFRWRAQAPAAFGNTLRSFGLTLAANMALPLLVPQIDIWAHAGGLLAGLAMGGLFSVPRLPPGLERKPPAWVIGLAALVAGGCIFALGRGAAYAWAPQEESMEVFLEGLARSKKVPAPLLNEFAWSIAIDPEPSLRAMRLARDLAQRAVELSRDLGPGQYAVLDTLATVELRLGDFASAIRHERQALALEPSALLYTQLARFEWKGAEREGPIKAGAPGMGASAELLMETAPEGKEGKRPPARIRARLSGNGGSGALLHAVLLNGEHLLGHLEIAVAPGKDTCDMTDRTGALSSLPGETRLLLTLIDGSVTPKAGAGTDCQWTFRPADEEALSLPSNVVAPTTVESK